MTTRQPLHSLRTTALVMAMTALLGCASADSHIYREGPTIQTAEIRLVEGSAGGPIEIDERYHDRVTVYPADRVEWSCANCPEGVEFSVTGLHFAADPGDHPPSGPCDELEAASPVKEGVDHPLFGTWKPPGPGADWFAHDEEIVSAPVANPGVKHGVWKFTWRVRKVEDPATEVCWDPHIFYDKP